MAQVQFDEMEEGKVYRFWKDVDHFWLVKMVEKGETCHWCEILDKGEETEGMDIGQKGTIYRTSRMFKIYHSHEVIDFDWKSKDEYRVGTDEERKTTKRRTKEEIEVDKLIAHVELKIKIDRLQAQIDNALELGDENAFMKLSNEYNKLRKKVMA